MIQAVVFDAYGTLYDVQSVTATTEQAFPGRHSASTSCFSLPAACPLEAATHDPLAIVKALRTREEIVGERPDAVITSLAELPGALGALDPMRGIAR